MFIKKIFYDFIHLNNYSQELDFVPSYLIQEF